MIRFKDDISEARERVEAWWKGDSIGSLLLQLRARREKPIFRLPAPEAPTIHDYWTNPKYVVPRILNTLGSMHYLAEAFPVIQPVAGRMVSITCKYLGAPNRYINKDTSWSEPIIESWEACPELVIDPQNEWWNITLELLESTIELIEEYDLECFLSLPDLNGPTEVLSGLRNPEKLCIDMLMEPDEVKKAAARVQKAWFKAWHELSGLTNRYGGYFTWMGVWSNLPAVDLQSDFSTLISPDMFAEFILPLVREQVSAFDRTIFHLDGPDMIRHLDMLLDIPGLTAIQWVQGAGAGKVSEWMELMHRIQESGKNLFIYCKPEEVVPLSRKLDSRGLMMVVDGNISLKDGLEIMDEAGRG